MTSYNSSRVPANSDPIVTGFVFGNNPRRQSQASFTSSHLDHGVENHYSKAFEHNGQVTSISMEQLRLPDYSQATETESSAQAARWEPGFWSRIPIWSILSMIASLACIVAALYILAASDAKPVDEWGYGIAPSVYLAIISVVINGLLGFALANGLVISFWRTALHGASLRELTRNYECGSSIRRAAWAGFRQGGRITALACIFSVVGLLRGPFNQRASTIETNVFYNTNGTVDVNLARTLPEGYTGVSVASRAPIMATARLTPAFNQVMNQYAAHSNILVHTSDCGDTCRASVKGFGFNSSCAFTTYSTYHNTSGFTQEMFSTRTTLLQLGEPSADGSTWDDTGLQINSTYYIGPNLTQKDVMASFVWRSHICNLTGGTINYEAQLTKGIAALSPGSRPTSFVKTKLRSPSNLGTDTTIGGFQFVMSYLFDSTATLVFGGAVDSTNLNGSLASQMFIPSINTSLRFDEYNDPINLMLDSLAEITFRASVRSGLDNMTESKQTVPYVGAETRAVYRTHRMFMGAAAGVSLASLIAIAATFWGWWELGRNMTMNPLEIAKAFDSPLLKNVGSNLPVNGMPSSVLTTRIRYGEYQDPNARSTGYDREQARGGVVLGFRADAEKPKRGQYYGL